MVAGADEVLMDRMDDLSTVASKSWDAVVDSCGYFPRAVRHSAEAFRDVARYLFISTISVYSADEKGGLYVKEQAPLETEEITPESYGPLKVECEKVLEEVFGDRLLCLRPGLLTGPFDPTNRFTYWVLRAAEGGDVLVPDWMDQPLEMLDARDLGVFQVLALEKGLVGIYDTAGDETTFGAMLAELPGNARFVKASAAFLEEQGVRLWVDLPFTFPEGEGAGSLMKVDSGKAKAEGLTMRPLEETARDTLAWAKGMPAEKLQHGLSREREAEVLGQMARVG
jgi:2'-hydroxyisoflavone reductase